MLNCSQLFCLCSKTLYFIRVKPLPVATLSFRKQQYNENGKMKSALISRPTNLENDSRKTICGIPRLSRK